MKGQSSPWSCELETQVQGLTLDKERADGEIADVSFQWHSLTVVTV